MDFKSNKFREIRSVNGNQKFEKIIILTCITVPTATTLVIIRGMSDEGDPGPGTTFDLTEMLRPKVDESCAILAEVRNRCNMI